MLDRVRLKAKTLPSLNPRKYCPDRELARCVENTLSIDSKLSLSDFVLRGKFGVLRTR